MATLVDVLDGIHDELVAVVDGETTVSDPPAHVDVLNRTASKPRPFLGFEYTRTPLERGMGGNVRAVDETYTDGTIDSVEKVQEWQLTVDIGVVTDSDDPRGRDAFLAPVGDQFAPYDDSPSAFHTDVSRFEARGTTPDRLGTDTNSGLRQTYVIEYARHRADTVPAAESIGWGVDVVTDSGEIDAYPEQY